MKYYSTIMIMFPRLHILHDEDMMKIGICNILHFIFGITLIRVKQIIIDQL